MKFTHSLVFILSVMLMPFSVQALEYEAEPAVMAYYQMSFGSHERKKNASFAGVRLDMQRVDRNGVVVDLNRQYLHKTAQMDFQIDKEGPRALNFNGVNSLTRTERVNADGTTSTSAGVDWGLVAIGVIGLGVIFIRDDEGGGNNKCKEAKYTANIEIKCLSD